MATVTATNGESFFVWPLPAGSARQVSPGIKVNRIRNDLGNGYRAQTLYGSDTGLRTWQVTQNTLGGADFPLPFVTGIDGESVSQEQALWDLYVESQITGKPFVYICPRDGVYYLVEFDNPTFEYEKAFRAAQYAGQVTITQVRENGVSLLDPWLQLYIQDLNGHFYDNTTHNSPNWNNRGGSDYMEDVLTTASFGAATQNGRNIVRLNPSGSASRFDSGVTPVYDAFFVLKVRETTFSNAGALIGTSSTAKIKGTSAGTKWANPGHSGLRYWMNSREYAVTDMQAPMDRWGVVRVRSATALVTGVNAHIGAETTSNGLKADIAEVQLYSEPLSVPFGRQIAEHLAIKWAVSI